MLYFCEFLFSFYLREFYDALLAPFNFGFALKKERLPGKNIDWAEQLLFCKGISTS